ncbi:unnamed protein product [Camellia sinensis]
MISAFEFRKMAKVYYIFDDDEDDDDKYGYFPDKFRIYKETELSCVQDDKTFYELHLWVFWSRYDNISKLPPLSISGSPIGESEIRSDLMISMEYKFYVDGDSEEELGLPGRVFRYKFLESSPDVRYYSTKEHPQGSHAVHCNVTQSLALPVFDPSSQSCVGVLELVTLTHDADKLLIKMEDQISEALQEGWKKVELEYSDPYFHGDILTNSKNDAFQYALNEIRDALKVVCQVHRLRLAQTWVPCWFCSNRIHGGTFDVSSEGRALCTIKTASYLAGEGEWPYGEDYTFLDACQSHHLRKGQGVVGRVLSSHKLLFCSDITRFSIADYPLAHYARKFGLTGCFAICLQSPYTRNYEYILEFFLPQINKDHGNLPTSLSTILGTMKALLKGFKLATGEKLRQDLSIEVIDFCNDERLDSMQTPQTNRYSPTLDASQNIREMMQLDSSNQESMDAINNGRNVVGAEQSNIHGADVQKKSKTKTSEREHRKGVIPISLEDLQRHSGMKVEDAANSLGSKWPPCKGLKNNHSPSDKTARGVYQERISESSQRDCPSSNQAAPTVGRTKQHIKATQDACNVTVKAKYLQKAIKFQLSSSSGIEELQQQVAKRLNLKAGTYIIEYKDDEDDSVLICCDDDLHDYMRTSSSLGSTLITIWLQPI